MGHRTVFHLDKFVGHVELSVDKLCLKLGQQANKSKSCLTGFSPREGEDIGLFIN